MNKIISVLLVLMLALLPAMAAFAEDAQDAPVAVDNGASSEGGFSSGTVMSDLKAPDMVEVSTLSVTTRNDGFLNKCRLSFYSTEQGPEYHYLTFRFQETELLTLILHTQEDGKVLIGSNLLGDYGLVFDPSAMLDKVKDKVSFDDGDSAGSGTATADNKSNVLSKIMESISGSVGKISGNFSDYLPMLIAPVMTSMKISNQDENTVISLDLQRDVIASTLSQFAEKNKESIGNLSLVLDVLATLIGNIRTESLNIHIVTGEHMTEVSLGVNNTGTRLSVCLDKTQVAFCEIRHPAFTEVYEISSMNEEQRGNITSEILSGLLRVLLEMAQYIPVGWFSSIFSSLMH